MATVPTLTVDQVPAPRTGRHLPHRPPGTDPVGVGRAGLSAYSWGVVDA
ncbi:hypothetical protein [Micromonospora sp. NPDC049497]